MLRFRTLLIILVLLQPVAGLCAGQHSKSIFPERPPPTPYGLKIVRSDDRPPGPVQAAAPEQPLPLADYLKSIDSAEISGGAYSAGLAEPLFGLGRAYQSADKHPQAMDYFQRALHLLRINEGLYSAGQLPLLKSIIDSQLALGELAAVDANRFYRYRVQRHVYPAGDPALVLATEEYSEWQREAYLEGLGDRTYRRLLDIHDMHSQEIERLEEKNPRDPALVTYLYQRLRGDYLVSQYEGEKEEEIQINISANSRARPAGNTDYHSERFRLIKENNFRNGRKTLEQILTVLEAQEPADALALARAKVAMGDWHLWTGRAARALQWYEQAYALLAQGGESVTQAHSVFEEVVELPVDRIFHPGAITSSQPARHARAVVLLDVSRLGRARRIKIVEIEPVDEMGARVALFDMLREVLFRPLVQGGEVVAATAIQREYIFEY